MTSFWKWGLVAVGALGVAAFLFFPKRAKAGEHVLVVGDSLTGSPGYCATLRQGLPRAKVLCVAKPGEGAKAVHDAAIKALQTFPASTAVVLAGVNDLASNRGLEHAKKALDALYQALDAQGVKVVAVTLTPWVTHSIGSALWIQKETQALNAWIRQHPIPVAVVETGGLTGQGKDGLHLTRAGGEELARLVLARIV